MTADDRFDLERFVTAQTPVFETVLAELRAGRKRSHWMWFIFPQLRGLGRSATARFYGISSIDEALAYLAHPLVGPRLVSITASDGETRHIGAGEIVLVEDTTGKGHVTKSSGDKPRYTIFVPIN